MASDDATEWVTVKLHKTVRDQARDDPRTYTQIMRDGLETDRFNDGDTTEVYEVGGEEPVDEIARAVAENVEVPDAIGYEDVVAASERGARNALEDLQ